MIFMQEVFLGPGESARPLELREYRVLELFEEGSGRRRVFVVQQFLCRWNSLDRQFMCEEMEVERYPLLIVAEERYEARSSSIRRKGYIQSDMEF